MSAQLATKSSSSSIYSNIPSKYIPEKKNPIKKSIARFLPKSVVKQVGALLKETQREEKLQRRKEAMEINAFSSSSSRKWALKTEFVYSDKTSPQQSKHHLVEHALTPIYLLSDFSASSAKIEQTRKWLEERKQQGAKKSDSQEESEKLIDLILTESGEFDEFQNVTASIDNDDDDPGKASCCPFIRHQESKEEVSDVAVNDLAVDHDSAVKSHNSTTNFTSMQAQKAITIDSIIEDDAKISDENSESSVPRTADKADDKTDVTSNQSDEKSVQSNNKSDEEKSDETSAVFEYTREKHDLICADLQQLACLNQSDRFIAYCSNLAQALQRYSVKQRPPVSEVPDIVTFYRSALNSKRN
jgi:hypothetical protein